MSRITGLFSTLGQFLLILNLPLLLMGAVPISWLAILLLIFAPTLSGLLQLALSRTREFDVDAEVSDSPMKKPIIIGVAGGTASGKTTVSRKILEQIGPEELAYIEHDAYYRDLSHLPMAKRKVFNFDHPDSLESELLIAHLEALLHGQPVQIPVYDFANYVRTEQLKRVEPKPIILVEGILIFVDKKLRDLMDIKIYVDTPADLRFIRRLKRDVAERGRTVNHVIDQYLDTVPAYAPGVRRTQQTPRGRNYSPGRSEY